MKRVLALAGALTVAALGLSACDGSPPVAKVNGQVLTVSAFKHQLSLWVSDKALVQQVNQTAAANAAQSGGAAYTVEGSGGPGTYSSQFVSQVLGFNIGAMAVQSYLDSHGQHPTQDELVAARAQEETNASSFWFNLPEPVRQLFVNVLADESVLAQAPSDLTTLQDSYTAIQPWLFSSICVLQSVSPDMAGADRVVASGHVNGAEVCFDQQKLEAQPAAVQTAVTGLTKIGQIAQPIKTTYGYQVLQLTSRTGPPLNAGVAQVLTADQSTPTQVSSIVTSAKVSLNVAYGSWTQGCLVPPGDTAQEACGSQQ